MRLMREQEADYVISLRVTASTRIAGLAKMSELADDLVRIAG
jgi:hypothetical protein